MEVPGSEIVAGAWIRCFHPVPDAAVRLVCLPHAGGAASFYLAISRAVHERADLSARVELLSVQYPGRQDRLREAPRTDLRVLADEVVAALRPWRGDRLVLFGHSMGATMAFEVARRLDPAPVALVLSGRRPPSLPRPREALHRLDDARLLARLRDLQGTEAQLLDNAEFVRLLLPAIRADYRAVETYECEPHATVDIPITVFVGDRDPHVTPAEASAWRDHTTDTFDVQVFAGGHFYLKSSPELTADRLGWVLRAHG